MSPVSPLAPRSPEPPARSIVDGLQVDGRKLGTIPAEIRIAIDGAGAFASRRAVAASPPASEVLAGRRAQAALRGMLRTIDSLGGESVLRGLSLTSTQEGFQAELARAQVEMDLRSTPDTPRSALQERATATFQQASKASLAGAFVSDPDARNGWLVLSPERSLPLLATWQHKGRLGSGDNVALAVDYAARQQDSPEDAAAFRDRALRRLADDPGAARNLRRNLVGSYRRDLLASVRTLAHEVDHSVTPLPDREVQRYRMLEEAAVDSIASTDANIERWRGVLRAPTVPLDSLDTVVSGYATIAGRMRHFMHLGGLDTAAQRRAVVQGGDVRELPARLAQAIASHAGVPAATVPKLTTAIQKTFIEGDDRTGEVLRLVGSGVRRHHLEG